MSNNGNINRDLLSCMTKEQLINMILGKQTVSVSQTGSVSQTASTKVGTVHKNKSLVQLAAENLEHSIKRPVILPKQSDKMPTLKTLAANAIFKDKIKYFEKLSDKQSSTIRLDKKAVSLQDMRDEELAKARVSKYMVNGKKYRLQYRPIWSIHWVTEDRFLKSYTARLKWKYQN